MVLVEDESKEVAAGVRKAGRVKRQPEPEESVWTTLAEVIAKRRTDLGMTKVEAARRAQVSGTTWRLLERGVHDSPADSTLIRVARTLRLDPAAVMTLVGRHEPNKTFKMHGDINQAIHGESPTQLLF